MSLLIAGDLVPYKKDLDLFKQKNTNRILGEDLNGLWIKSEHRVFNLEAPIINEANAILKYGPNLKIDEDCIIGIKALNPSIIALANNHIMDYGKEGLKNTLKLLEKNKLNYIGVGENINNIKKYDIIYVDNKTVAIYNTCEIEFSVATKNSSGAFGYDEGQIIKDLLSLKNQCDYIVVIYHGGKEHYRYPSPLLQKRCRLLADFGADLIVCQHSHCIGCMEKYESSYIIYGQGNFIFNGSNSEYWNDSLIIDVSFKKNIQLNFIPIIKLDRGIEIPQNELASDILKEFNKRSEEIKEEGFIEKKYNEYSKKMIKNYIINFHGTNLFFRILLKLTNKKILNVLYNKKNYLAMQNNIECEAHRELIINGLKNINKL